MSCSMVALTTRCAVRAACSRAMSRRSSSSRSSASSRIRSSASPSLLNTSRRRRRSLSSDSMCSFASPRLARRSSSTLRCRASCSAACCQAWSTPSRVGTGKGGGVGDDLARVARKTRLDGRTAEFQGARPDLGLSSLFEHAHPSRREFFAGRCRGGTVLGRARPVEGRKVPARAGERILDREQWVAGRSRRLALARRRVGVRVEGLKQRVLRSDGVDPEQGGSSRLPARLIARRRSAPAARDPRNRSSVR